jgi:para-nitrobenzyl esterase
MARMGGVPATRDGFASLDEATVLTLQTEAGKGESGDPMGESRDLLANGLQWGPLLDGDLLAQPTLEAIRAGVGADKPLVFGTTDDEFTMATDGMRRKLRLVPAAIGLAVLGLRGPRGRAYLAANRHQRRKGTAAVLGRFVTDTVFRAPLVRIAQARSAGSGAHGVDCERNDDAAPTWVYRFVWVSPSIGWACHCLDMPFWWDCLDSPVGVEYTAGPHPPQALADAVHGAAVGFIRSRDAGWTPWSSSPGTTRLFGADASARDVVADGYASAQALI